MDLVINLLPWREWRIAACQRLMLWILALSLLLSISGAMLMWRAHVLTTSALQKEQKALSQTLEAQSQERQAYKHVVAQMKDNATKNRQHREYMEKNRRIGVLLKLLSRHIPPGLWLTRMESENDTFVLQGIGTDTLDISAFTGRLKDRAGPLTVTLEVLERHNDGQIAFTMRGVWENMP